MPLESIIERETRRQSILRAQFLTKSSAANPEGSKIDRVTLFRLDLPEAKDSSPSLAVETVASR